ncbi:hypothetical protein [Lentzea sp. NPDC055074]
MQIGYGNGGWVRLDGAGLPGAVYARFDKHADGTWRVYELYLDGAGEPLPTDVVRELPTGLLASVVVGEEDHLERRLRTPGPDLRRLAGHYATTWGTLTHDGRACDTCGGPVKGGNWRREKGIQEAMHNWVAEAWFAQFHDSTVRQAPAARERDGFDVESEEFPLITPPAGSRITGEFLETVARAYRLAVLKGLHPAPAIAELARVSPKTVRKWVAKARERGVLPPGRKGRVG